MIPYLLMTRSHSRVVIGTKRRASQKPLTELIITHAMPAMSAPIERWPRGNTCKRNYGNFKDLMRVDNYNR